MKKRIMLMGSVLGVLAFAFLIFRLFDLQVLSYKEYQAKAISQQTRDDLIPPKRGTIYDRNMMPLAVSATAEEIFISPVEIRENQRELVARGLSEILGVDYDKILKKTTNRNQHETIANKVEKELADKVREFKRDNNIKGIYFSEDPKRYYVYANFASHLLGFTNFDGVGQYGIESMYENYLQGTPGRLITAKNAAGQDMPSKYETYFDAEDGLGIVLTIDENIQHFLENHLETALADTLAKAQVSGIVMNVRTGEILAMANKGDYDPNNPRKLSDEILEMIENAPDEEKNNIQLQAFFDMWRNKIIQDTYEPGSVFKIVTAAMAMEEGLIGSNDRFYCGGSVKVGDRTVSCWKTAGHGSQTFDEAVRNSCNCAFIEIGRRIGTKKFMEYMDLFGLAKKTGIDLPGEAGSILHPTSKFNDIELAIAAFGQRFKITPIQMITAVAAVANGGKLMQPYLVKDYLDKDGNVVKSNQPTMVRQVMSEATARELASILESVVAIGTGTNAYVRGYHVAGKTGTSEKFDSPNDDEEDKRIATFCAFAPADDPVIAVLVIIDEPDVPVKFGGTIAAPVVGRIMADVLPYLGVEPRYTEKELATMEIAMPDIRGMKVSDAKAVLSAKKFNPKTEGKDDIVTDQIPAAGTRIPSGSSVIIYAGAPKTAEMVMVPTLSAMTYAQAERTLANLGLYIATVGAAGAEGNSAYIAAKQAPEPGQMVERGASILVEFIDPRQYVN